jgi:hypothetical protein
MLGIGVNFSVCGFTAIIWPVSLAWVGADSPATAAAASMMSSAGIRFDLTVMSLVSLA